MTPLPSRDPGPLEPGDKGALPGSGWWIGVDLDGTLARYDGWAGHAHIGEPIPAMVERVKGWLVEGWEVRVFTARCSMPRDTRDDVREWIAFVGALKAWCIEHVGCDLRPTCFKDYHCVEIWDDRAVGVEFNTGAVRGGERPLRI